MKKILFPFFYLVVAFLSGVSGGFLVNLWEKDAQAQSPPNPSQTALLAGELRLVDATGRTRLLMTLLRGKPRLLMLDDNGEYRLELGLGDTGEPHVWLRDSDGASKVQLALTSKGLPSITLADQKNRVRAILALSQEGEPTFLLKDRQEKDRVALFRNNNTEGLALADERGVPIASFSAVDGERPSFDIY
ncbi:MAG: hypothetical protein LBF22_09920 [Deltaproteobacteria bacterium]|jgi:hypothetical protein|nr:hypothetical protein [Deltaproteobacteria bacterium]